MKKKFSRNPDGLDHRCCCIAVAQGLVDPVTNDTDLSNANTES